MIRQLFNFLKKVNKKINNTVIFILLILFYVFGIGLGKIVQLIFINEVKNKDTYWTKKNLKLNDITSAY